MNQTGSTNWWGRNWKWFVPVGCLGNIVFFGGFMVALWFGITSIMKSNESYQMALVVAKKHPKIIEVLGQPIEEGLFLTGSINESGPKGNVDLQIPLSGPKGKGALYLKANKVLGKWSIRNLVFELESTKERINLLELPATQPNKSIQPAQP